MKPILFAALVALSAGCATLKDASDSKGSGTSAVYDADYDSTWSAAVLVVEESKLDLIAKDKEEGKILAQKGMSAFSYGENVAIFIESKDEQATSVEVVSKRSLATNITARNWSSYIHSELHKKLSK